MLATTMAAMPPGEMCDELSSSHEDILVAEVGVNYGDGENSTRRLIRREKRYPREF